MFTNKAIIRIMGISLAVLYGLSFFLYLALLRFPVFFPYNVVILAAFLLLFVAAFGIMRFEEWARRLMIIFNALLGSLLIGLFLMYPQMAEPFYIFVSLGVILFFNQVQIRALFQSDLKFSRQSILVVDDDEGFLRTMSRILLNKGYSVLTATTGERGLQIAKLQQPHLVILDVILPGIKGREVCQALKEDEKTRNIPIIFVTAKDSPDDVAAEMAAGGDSHLTKPIDAKTLLTAIKSCLG